MASYTYRGFGESYFTMDIVTVTPLTAYQNVSADDPVKPKGTGTGAFLVYRADGKAEILIYFDEDLTISTTKVANQTGVLQ
ncbi:hypothetical protein ABEB36_010595 [Hypothenemus hampei]|uniref:Uncharacterized protein n=1 Tax=Hypothenemus hampei TaxID=57062 RepID=A0ABD1EF85_HYPHA